MKTELNNIFRRNFPFIIRSEETVNEILNDPKNVIFEKRNNNNLIGVCVVNENTILLLCVDKDFRNCGIGTELLNLAEQHILNCGYHSVKVGAGKDYLMPGVPTNVKVVDEELKPDNIFEGVSNHAYIFFKNKGYTNLWDCNCFDMYLNLNEFETNLEIGSTINGVSYEWATIADKQNVVDCVKIGYEEFVKYYLDDNLYVANNGKKVLIAKANGKVVGSIIICMGVEKENVGSVGCTVVIPEYRGKHIGVNLTILSTKHLKDSNFNNAFLGYTYTGLDVMYGYAGYKICVYYFMATKQLKNKG